jgi:hypothetical protein
MEQTVFAYQFLTEPESSLAFAATLGECQREAKQKRDFTATSRLDSALPSAIAVYRFTLRCLSREELITVLNREMTLLDAAVVDRRLVAVLGDEGI